MSYFDSFIAINKTPSEDIKIQLQELVNETFEVASTFHKEGIYRETSFGTLEFEKIEARITNLIDPKTGEKIEDDYKKITFQDLSFVPELGSRYKFDNNIWIVFSTGNIKTTTSSAYLRRCNNTMNFQDLYGKVHKEPCYIDYKPTKTSILEYDTTSIPYTKQILYCQLNNWTKSLSINSRFLFGEDVYKITERAKFNRTETFEESSIKLIKAYMDYDNINEYDNQDLGIADYKNFNYMIKTQKEIIGAVGFSSILSAKVTLDDKEINEEVFWYSEDEDIVTINKTTGEYIFNSLGQTTIKSAMVNNEDFYTEIIIQVLDEEAEIYENIISPDIDILLLNKEQKFSVYETLNGQMIDTNFIISAQGVLGSYYSLRVVGNDFYITNKKMNKKDLLKITCINQRNFTEIIIELELGGIF